MNKHRRPIRGLSILLGCFILIMSTGSLSFLFAQNYDQPTRVLGIRSSFNPMGSGARALGMGGAFIAIANDATAASWNPGGLLHLEWPEISFVGNTFYRIEDNKSGTNPEASGSQRVSKNSINYLSFAYPFYFLRRNMTISVNYQHLYDFTRKWKFPLIKKTSGYSLNNNIDYKQEGGLYALGIAYGIQVTPEFSLGLTINIWDDFLKRNEWKNRLYQRGLFIYQGHETPFETSLIDRYSFKGFNVNLGTQMQFLNDKLTIGAVLKTPFRANLKHECIFDPNNPGSLYDEKLDMPMSFGIGLAYRFSDFFTGSLDFYRTEWKNFAQIYSSGNKVSPITNKPISESDIDPTYQVRMGVEYFILTSRYTIPLRAGIFYDPAPAVGSPDNYFGISLGSGINLGNLTFDMAYQYRFGKNVGASFFSEAEESELNFSQDVKEHSFFFSVIYRFGKGGFFRK